MVIRKMENFSSGHGNDTVNFEGPQLARVSGAAVFLAGLNVFLSITASLGNVLILIALHKVTSIYPPTKLLFRCLAVTDLFVGLITQPFFCITLMHGIVNTNNNLHLYSHLISDFTGHIFSGVSLLTSAAISVDRLLVLLLGSRYRHVVTLGKTWVVVTCCWFLPCLSAGLRFSPWGFVASRAVAMVLISLLSLLIAALSYIRIYFGLRHHQLQVQDRAQQGQPSNEGAAPLNITRYQKLVSSIAWVQFTFLFCYTPFIAVLVLLSSGTPTRNDSYLTYFRVTTSIVFLNSSLNPILYCWKIREVKQAVRDSIRQVIYCLKSN